MEMRMQHKNIDQVHYMIDMIHGMFYMFVSLDHKIVNLNIPYKDHHQAYSVLGMMYRLMDQLLVLMRKGTKKNQKQKVNLI